MRKNKSAFFILVFAICHLPSAICYSQPITNSPYSRYGLGDLQSSSFANTIPMGGLYNAVQNDTMAPFYMNASNPASHASLRLTVFDIGFKSNTTQLQTIDKDFRTTQSALSYIALGFPVTKFWGMSIGLLPYSSVGYKIYDTVTVDSIGKVNYSYEGTGGINQLYLGNGIRIKDLYVGVTVSKLFGDLIYFSYDSFPKASNFFNTKYSQTTHVGDYRFTFGAQYKYALKNNWSVIFGATGGLKTNLNVKRTTFGATYENDFGVQVIKDTVVNEVDVDDTLTMPMVVGGGIVFKKGDRWMFGLDYTMQNWSAFTSFGQTGLLKNSQQFSFGAQYVPNKNAGVKEEYFKKIYYRAGFRYGNTFLELGNTPIKEYTVTLGAGFPLRKIKVGEVYSQSIVNIGLEFGKRGTTEIDLIQENYFKAVLGVTLNDRWFIKRKYD